MQRLTGWFMMLALLAGTALGKDLKIYFIDVEGGQCTLIITPKGESILVDTGWPLNDSRDAVRIATVAKKAKIKQIDWLIITHHHTDHVGGITTLMDKMKVVNLVSHGTNTESGKNAEQLARQYEEARKQLKEMIVKPGDRIPINGVDLEIITARGEILNRASALARGAAENPLCAKDTKKAPDTTENGKSVGFLLKFGEFRFLDLADLTWNLEGEVACPVNKVGKVDLYLTNHHGLWQSNNPTFVHALDSKAMILNNGANKGGEIAALDSLRAAPGLKDFWQLHYSIKAGKEHNVEDPYIANLTAPGGYHFEVTVKPNGSFTILNQRNKFTKSY